MKNTFPLDRTRSLAGVSEKSRKKMVSTSQKIHCLLPRIRSFYSFFETYFAIIPIMISKNSSDKEALYFNKDLLKYFSTIQKSYFHSKNYQKKSKLLVSTSRNMVRFKKTDFPPISVIVSTSRKKSK